MGLIPSDCVGLIPLADKLPLEWRFNAWAAAKMWSSHTKHNFVNRAKRYRERYTLPNDVRNS